LSHNRKKVPDNTKEMEEENRQRNERIYYVRMGKWKKLKELRLGYKEKIYKRTE
jgi:hypothetical protein